MLKKPPQYIVQFTNVDGAGYFPDPEREWGEPERPYIFSCLAHAVKAAHDHAASSNTLIHHHPTLGDYYNCDAYYYKVRDQESGQLVYTAPFVCGHPPKVERVEEEWFGSYQALYEEELKGIT